MSMSKRTRRFLVLAGVCAGYAVGTVVATRRGYKFGRNVAVRCRDGHLFSTVWIPGASVKSLRFGLWRLQWCPVGRHFSLVHPVKDAGLSDAERAFAAEHHDVPVP